MKQPQVGDVVLEFDDSGDYYVFVQSAGNVPSQRYRYRVLMTAREVEAYIKRVSP